VTTHSDTEKGEKNAAPEIQNFKLGSPRYLAQKAKRASESEYELSGEGLELVISGIDLSGEDTVEVLGFVSGLDTLELSEFSIFIYCLLALLSIRDILTLLTITLLLAFLRVRLSSSVFRLGGLSLLLLLVSLLLLLLSLLGSLSSLLLLLLTLSLGLSSGSGSGVRLGSSGLRWSNAGLSGGGGLRRYIVITLLLVTSLRDSVQKIILANGRPT
jgi:hypothetical protein